MHSAAQHERGGGGRAAPCTRSELEQQQQQQQKLISCGEAGWVRLRGPLQVRPCKLGRRLLVCAVLRTRQDRGWASCPTRPRHASGPCGSRPRNRTHPAFDSFSRSAVDPRHAWINLCRISKSIGSQIRFPMENGSDPMTPVIPGPIQPSPGNCQWWGGVGWQDRWRHGWRHRAPMDGFTACPASPHRPAKPAETQSRFGFGFGCCRPAAGTTAGAGRSPAAPPSPAHENDFTDFSKPSCLRHASTILRSSMRPRATHAKKRPPIA